MSRCEGRNVWHTSKVSQKSFWRMKLWSVLQCSWKKTAPGNLRFWFNYLIVLEYLLSKCLAYTFPGTLKRERCHSCSCILSCMPSWGWSPLFTNLSAAFQNTKPIDTNELGGVIQVVFFFSNFCDIQKLEIEKLLVRSYNKFGHF